MSYQVRSLRHFIPEYSDARKIILDAVKDEELTIEERINLYQSEMNKLRKQFIDERTSEYKSKSVQVQRGHSCTKGNRGGKKDCGWKCATAPQPSLYTQSGWFSVSGTNKGTQVRDNGRHACLKMTKAGKGRNAGVITATFRYRPEYIAATVQEEATELFYLISNPENAGE